MVPVRRQEPRAAVAPVGRAGRGARRHAACGRAPRPQQYISDRLVVYLIALFILKQIQDYFIIRGAVSPLEFSLFTIILSTEAI